MCGQIMEQKKIRRNKSPSQGHAAMGVLKEPMNRFNSAC